MALQAIHEDENGGDAFGRWSGFSSERVLRLQFVSLAA